VTFEDLRLPAIYRVEWRYDHPPMAAIRKIALFSAVCEWLGMSQFCKTRLREYRSHSILFRTLCRVAADVDPVQKGSEPQRSNDQGYEYLGQHSAFAPSTFDRDLAINPIDPDNHGFSARLELECAAG
jgi:hypothetical protein